MIRRMSRSSPRSRRGRIFSRRSRIRGSEGRARERRRGGELCVGGDGRRRVEFASFYNTLGVDVTLVEILDQILPVEDAEIAQAAEQAFKKQGIEVLTSTGVDSVKTKKNGLVAEISGEAQDFDALILSVGVQGNIEGLDLPGVSHESGFITVDATQQTSVNGIYAIGDVAGAPCLAHKASHEGIIAGVLVTLA